ncbi:lactonase family protein [Rhizobium sp. NFR03]|uniref:lactonase family protein n=1 Tax=Rhizobium sp. NFR03 TaxID=1566263 RepID=UPI0008D2281C|nr:lactonase family protein [Rhizobium sp. NFR03]SES22239.1 6-phosphogluconolactonase [Rhizobium sp. NFR03]
MAELCLMFVGSLNREAPYFQGARGTGLTVYGFDEDTLAVETLGAFSDIDNPTFLSVTPDGRRIYANSEIFGWAEGLVSALSFDKASGRIEPIGMQPTLGSITAHNTLSDDGKWLLVVNYGMGAGGPDQSLVVYGIREDGRLTPPVSSVQQAGSGPDADRQERSHAHSVTRIGPNLLLVADLGTDTLTTYALDEEGTLSRRHVCPTAPGAGPRHAALHPGGGWIFFMNELDSTVSSYAVNGDGRLTLADTQPAVPEDAKSANHCADIQISPDGRFVYGSNRGHDSIVIFAVNAETGALTLVGHTPCGGATPRNLAISPSGRHLLCANQNADVITIFARDADTGALAPTGKMIAVGTPMCIRFAGSS